MWRTPYLLSTIHECLMQREMLSGCLPRKTVDKRIKRHARLRVVDMRLRRHVQLPRVRGSFRDLHLPDGARGLPSIALIRNRFQCVGNASISLRIGERITLV